MLALITDMYFVARPVQALNSNSVVNFRALHQPTASILGHSNAHHHHHDKNHSSKEPANDEGAFCCHYSTVATDACNTCQAPSTTGHCAIAADNCTACGGAWCLPATPSPTPMNYVAPLPGISATTPRTSRTCAAPAKRWTTAAVARTQVRCRSWCKILAFLSVLALTMLHSLVSFSFFLHGLPSESCAACGGGSGSGWCQALTAPKSALNASTVPAPSPPTTAAAAAITDPKASSKPVDTDAAASSSDKHAASSDAADAKTPDGTSDDKHKLAGSAGSKTTPPPPASDDNDNTPF